MRIELNKSLNSVRGKMDSWVYRHVAGKTVVSGLPERKETKPTRAQDAQRDRFTGAIKYAQRVLTEPCQRFVYEALARERGRRADKLATSDFLTPPVIEWIELSGYAGRKGDLIRVVATDDVEVVSVEVEIVIANSQVLEQGLATKDHGVWLYRATNDLAPNQRVSIVAVAKDRPGNLGVGTATFREGGA